MDCASCAALVEMDMEDLGVLAKCSYAKSTLEVEFDPKKVTPLKIKDVINSAGYTLQE